MIPEATNLTRAELIEHIRARRVVIGAQQGNRAQVTIDHGRRSENHWVPLDWVKPMLAGQVDGKAGR